MVPVVVQVIGKQRSGRNVDLKQPRLTGVHVSARAPDGSAPSGNGGEACARCSGQG
jgi:hypothetical protein